MAKHLQNPILLGMLADKVQYILIPMHTMGPVSFSQFCKSKMQMILEISRMFCCP